MMNETELGPRPIISPRPVSNTVGAQMVLRQVEEKISFHRAALSSLEEVKKQLKNEFKLD